MLLQGQGPARSSGSAYLSASPQPLGACDIFKRTAQLHLAEICKTLCNEQVGDGGGGSTHGAPAADAGEAPATQADGTAAAVQSLISQYEHSLRVSGQADEGQQVVARRRTTSQQETHAPATSSPMKSPFA